MLKCKQVTHLVASDEITSLSWWGRWQVRLHLLMCVHCRRYVRQVRAIGRAARELWGAPPVDEKERERLEREILSHLH